MAPMHDPAHPREVLREYLTDKACVLPRRHTGWA